MSLQAGARPGVTSGRAAEKVARAGELTLAPDKAGRRARQSGHRAWAQIRIAAEPASISGAAQPSPFMVRLGPPLHERPRAGRGRSRTSSSPCSASAWPFSRRQAVRQSPRSGSVCAALPSSWSRWARSSTAAALSSWRRCGPGIDGAQLAPVLGLNLRLRRRSGTTERTGGPGRTRSQRPLRTVRTRSTG